MKNGVSVIVAGIALSVLILPLQAHHSIAPMFNSNSKALSLKGTITRIELRNPHSYFYLDVTDATGQIQNWKIEYGGGWMLPAGSKVPPGVVVKPASVIPGQEFVATDEKATFAVLKVGERVVAKGLQTVDGTFLVAFTSLLDEQGKSIIG